LSARCGRASTPLRCLFASASADCSGRSPPPLPTGLPAVGGIDPSRLPRVPALPVLLGRRAPRPAPGSSGSWGTQGPRTAALARAQCGPASRRRSSRRCVMASRAGANSRWRAKRRCAIAGCLARTGRMRWRWRSRPMPCRRGRMRRRGGRGVGWPATRAGGDRNGRRARAAGGQARQTTQQRVLLGLTAES